MPNFIDSHDAAIERVAHRFSTFPDLSKGKVIDWLRQFREQEQYIALKLLEHTSFYDMSQVQAACREIMRLVTEGGIDYKHAIIVGLGPAGKSGSLIQYYFRHANHLTNTHHQPHFKTQSEISLLPREYNGSIIFLDDFIGSGRQSAGYLSDVTSIAPEAAQIAYYSIVGYISSMQEVERLTSYPVAAIHSLDASTQLFKPECDSFSQQEKDILKAYCVRTGASRPLGYEEIGSLIIFSHGVPNTTPAVLTHRSDAWMPLFPR